MPFLAVLVAAAQIGHRPDATALQPGIASAREVGPARRVEAAVAGEDGGCAPVELLVLAPDDEHGHARAVLRVVEDLVDREGFGIDGHVEPEVQLRATVLYRGAPDLARPGER